MRRNTRKRQEGEAQTASSASEAPKQRLPGQQGKVDAEVHFPPLVRGVAVPDPCGALHSTVVTVLAAGEVWQLLAQLKSEGG